MATNHARDNWRPATGSHPCPICGRPDWCRLSPDGTLAACRRVETGAWRTKTDSAGTPYYLHRLDGATAATPAPPPPLAGTAADRADPDTLHRVYSALLAALPLTERDRGALCQRGLPDVEIDRRLYRTLSGQGRPRIARELHERLGDVVLRVPGFIIRDRDGRRYLTISGVPGLVVPVRDTAGRVVALLVRREEDGPGKYQWVSSAKHGGPGPGAPVHVPLGVVGPAEVVRVTEGSLKSDVAHAVSGLPSVGLPGVSTWRPVLPMLRALEARTIRLSIDADARNKPPVARALAAIAEGLHAEGFTVELERWPAAHKGIDDALVAGAAVEVLAGDAARQAIAEIVAEGTTNGPGRAPGPLDRLDEALADGPEALYRNGELLRALAAIAENNPGEFACLRARLNRSGVRLRDLDATLSPLRQVLRAERPPLTAAGEYRVSAGRITHLRPTRHGRVETPLCNFAARIVEQVSVDDGAERSLRLAVEGQLHDGTPLARADLPAERFAALDWIVPAWGTRAVVFAGPGIRDNLRAALQMLSGEVPRRTVYGHLGWRELDGRWYFLHAAGAIGADGPAAGVEVSLPDPVVGFALPAPPAGATLVAALRASLALLDGLAPDRLAFPLLGGVYRAALGEAPGPLDLSLFLAGPHGAGKTELAALCQQHYGAGLDARHLPGSWSSTGNALEGLAFVAKDALLAVDDWSPQGSAADVQRLRREADRVLRGQGNRAGRLRMRADGSLRPARPPRGLILSTGEEVPPGQSLRGRMLVLEVSPGEVSLARLTPHQRAASAGLFAQALAGFVRWLAPRYGELSARLPAQRAALRDRALSGAPSGSPRTPGIVADLALGLELFFDFAREAGAVSESERSALARRGQEVLRETAAAQADHDRAAEPAAHFLRLLAGALASGRAHVADRGGDAPREAEALGWRRVEYATHDGPRHTWEPRGRCIGWVDESEMYLQPEASHAAAQEMARDQTEALPVSSQTLGRRLKERGQLASWDARRQRTTVRRNLGGVKDREVWHLHAGALFPCSEPSEPSAESGGPRVSAERGTVSADGNGICGGNRPPEPSANPAENPACGRCGRSETGRDGPYMQGSPADAMGGGVTDRTDDVAPDVARGQDGGMPPARTVRWLADGETEASTRTPWDDPPT